MNGLLGPNALYMFILRAAAVLLVIPFHEAAHAFVSWKLGDPTAKNAGRLSLNPLRHFDPLGTLCMVLGGVGWARPVGIDARRFRDPKKGMALSAAAGPAANLLLAYVCVLLYKALFYLMAGGAAVPGFVLDFLSVLASLNISLGVFNLIPVHPLDGSRVLDAYLPFSWSLKLQRYQPVIILLFVFALWRGWLNIIMSRVAGQILSLSAWFVGLFL